MHVQGKNIDKQRNALLNLLKDKESFDKLQSKSQSINVFEILKSAKTEIRHSNMLAWLLDPNQNHGLGDAFLQRFIEQISDIDDSLMLKCLSLNLYSFQVFREYRFESYPVDILLISKENNIIIAIENKLFSNEHNAGKTNQSQLNKYKEGIKKKFRDYDLLLVFLTPEGLIPTDSDWCIMSYEDMMKALEYIYETKCLLLKDEVKLIVKNYIEIIKKEIIMDAELEKLCKDIYSKHKDALDLLYENREDLTKRVSVECKTILGRIQEGKNYGLHLENSNKKSTIRFWTENLESYFKGLQDWTKDDNYWYQIEIRPKGNSVGMTLQLVFHREKTAKLNDEIIKKLKKILPEKQREKINNDQWEWTRIWATKPFDPFENTFEDLNSLEQWIKDNLDVFFTKEKKMLQD